jgi:hypothetical protein
MTDVSCPVFDIAKLRRSFVPKTICDPQRAYAARIANIPSEKRQAFGLATGVFRERSWLAFGAHSALDAGPELALDASRRDVHFDEFGNSGLPDLRIADFQDQFEPGIRGIGITPAAPTQNFRQFLGLMSHLRLLDIPDVSYPGFLSERQNVF